MSPVMHRHGGVDWPVASACAICKEQDAWIDRFSRMSGAYEEAAERVVRLTERVRELEAENERMHHEAIASALELARRKPKRWSMEWLP